MGVLAAPLSLPEYLSGARCSGDCAIPIPKPGTMSGGAWAGGRGMLEAAAFATMTSRAGAADRILRSYLGHAAGDMLDAHYRRIELEESRSVSGLINGWRELEKADVPGNIPATFRVGQLSAIDPIELSVR